MTAHLAASSKLASERWGSGTGPRRCAHPGRRLCRTADWINPARVYQSHHRLGRGTLTPGPAILRTVLQRNENTSILGQRFTSLAIGSADWMHHIRMRFLVD